MAEVNLDDLKPNSHQYHKDVEAQEPENEKKEPKPDLSANVTSKKRPLYRRFIDVFLKDGASPKEIRKYLVEDVIVPAVLDNISDIVTSSIEMMFFGSAKRKSKGASSGGNFRVDYGSFSSGNGNRRRERLSRSAAKETSNREPLDDYIFDSRGDAEMVLVDMRELLDRFEQVTVLDYLDILTGYGISVKTEPSDDKYGWKDLSNVEPTRARGGGYFLNLPRERLL